MLKNKKETGLIVVKSTKFDKIRRKIMLILYGKDYKIIEKYDKLLKVNRPQNIIIPKEMKQ